MTNSTGPLRTPIQTPLWAKYWSLVARTGAFHLEIRALLDGTTQCGGPERAFWDILLLRTRNEQDFFKTCMVGTGFRKGVLSGKGPEDL